MAIKAIFKRIPYLEAVISFLQQLGLWQFVLYGLAVMSAGLWALWGWIESNLPYWAIGLLFLVALAISLFAIKHAIEIYRKISAERLDHEAIGDDLINLSDEMTRSISDYLRERTLRQRETGEVVPPYNPEQARQRWEKDRKDEEIFRRHIGERYGRRIMAAVILLKKLDISLPFHLSHFDEQSIMGTASFFGAVGQLIKSGNISVAQKIDDNTSWMLAGLVR